MLLPPALVYAVGGVGAAALVGVIASDRLGTPRKWVTRALLGVMIICAGVTFTLLLGTARVAQLTPQLTLEHSLLLGSTTLRIGDHDVDVSGSAGSTIVVNHARVPARIETIIYGASGLTAPAEIAIAPASMYVLDAKLDYLGPDQPPPDEISSKSSGETKYWLTW